MVAHPPLRVQANLVSLSGFESPVLVEILEFYLVVEPVTCPLPVGKIVERAG